MRHPLPAVAARGSRVLSVGAYRPRRIVGNDVVAARTGHSPEWIVSRSGIENRRHADDDETLAMMSAAAAEKALAAAGVDAGRIGCVILATITHLEQTPAVAVDVAHRLGARQATAFDLSAACAGFCHALSLAGDLVRLGQIDYALVIGAERLTDIIDLQDPDTAFLFADGAGAVVVGPAEETGIGPVVWQADGSRKTALEMTGAWTRDIQAPDAAWPIVRMSGWRVFRWASEALAPAVHEILRKSELDLDDLDAFIPHQANLRITEHVVKELGLAEHTAVGRDIVNAGNTSGASIPLAMEQLLSSGEVASGDTALLLGFGAGVVLAGQIIHLP
jgi:3-oxoacyl-[acyl-carrier-protein] synthase-3